MKVLTITLNPSIDTTIVTEKLYDGIICVPKNEWKSEGGKGINLSTALRSMGKQTVAVVVGGEKNLASFTRLIGDKYPLCSVVTRGKIRENIAIVSGDEEYRINRGGSASVKREEIEKVAEYAEKIISQGDIVAICGSLPEGTSKEEIIYIAERLKNKGAQIAVDCVCLGREDILRIAPLVCKPNREEFADFCGKKSMTESEIESYAKALSQEGITVLVSLGKDGLIGAANGKVIRVTVPNVAMKTTVSAGDTTLAGYLCSYIEGKGFEESVRFAAASGTVAVKCGGARFISVEEIEKIKQEVRISNSE